MKKIFTLFTSLLLLGAPAFAQEDDEELDETFVFVDANGNTIADGTVLNINTLNEEGQMVVPLWVKNTSGDRAAVSMWETIDGKPSGDWQTCAFGSCMILRQTGYSAKSIVDADYFGDIETEWIPEEEDYASWTATLQIHVFNISQKVNFGQTLETAGDVIIGYGPKVTVNFTYADPAGIDDAQRTTAQARSYYSADGRRLPAARKGLNIVRTADGSVRKVLMK